ncbi:hypothetical protein COO91_09032 [Nostoc flagelliforme CCNUN1]|uniref:Uncharacterized protein n=1 Tax=Nostoc flagelliforme CCNUN1 TaxID=2038116 RepID=A0A2K8T5N0_9NOSO|nr:hypothetical protein COO91_09032 [Nostoc flagelliforme CCNUN1]
MIFELPQRLSQITPNIKIWEFVDRLANKNLENAKIIKMKYLAC